MRWWNRYKPNLFERLWPLALGWSGSLLDRAEAGCLGTKEL